MGVNTTIGESVTMAYFKRILTMLTVTEGDLTVHNFGYIKFDDERE